MDYAAYKRDESCQHYLLYPRCKYQHRNNPYRRYKIARDHASKTVREIFDLKEAAHLENLKVTVLTLTFPKELSQALAEKSTGLDIAWRTFQRFWDNCFLALDKDSPGLSCMANLHFWSSILPLLPHFHIHILLLNYRLVLVAVDPENGQSFELVERRFPVNEDGKRLPFTKSQFEQLRSGWKLDLKQMAFRHKIPCPSLENDGDVNLEAHYFDLNRSRDRAGFSNYLKYQTRPPIVDYARYSNKNLNCPDPTELIQTYTNKTRVYGWLNNRKGIIGTLPATEKTKLSPFDSKPMIYAGRLTLDQVLYTSGGELGSLDFRKGKPILRDLSQDDIDWLRKADYWTYPNTGWFKEHLREQPPDCPDSPPP